MVPRPSSRHRGIGHERGGRRRLPLAFATLAAALAACGSGAPATPAASTLACSHAKVVSEQADRTTVRLCVRQTLILQLHSTYWKSASSSADAVLHRTGPTTIRPAAPGTCVPGAGCGTATTHFVGVTRGRARVSAQRLYCGEAILCRKGQRSFVVTVLVRRRPS